MKSDAEKKVVRKFWALVILAFVLSMTAWTCFFILARAHPAQEVPLETRE